eukprot:CAMPEP_0119280606 /NCGR_PEP_ID=MMETSP1329-20130426/23048_1 /TAXON_ID=114041 /ORGANISM="Genus nov. species nov., Strain RCC1024" /LENGTH=151 /DNA_ID=CAMNT_0007281201 /DNA_START=156 /DNA_END=607 /DNA_ORIENTATION=+
MINAIISWCQTNPFHAVIFALFILFKVFQKNQPFPECGGRVKAVHTTNEFYEAVADAKKRKRLLLCDFYATWCPPCRKAAPIYGRLSEQYDKCDFIKLDVDECKGVARKEEVSAMPTFKLYKNGEAVYTCTGFDVTTIKAKLEEFGAKLLP